MVSTSIVRKALAEYFREHADWRRAKADEYPSDLRNRESAKALESLAAYIDGLADDDGTLLAFAELPVVFDESVFDPPRGNPDINDSRSGDEASRCGFHSKESPRDWLVSWLETVKGEAAEYVAALADERSSFASIDECITQLENWTQALAEEVRMAAPGVNAIIQNRPPLPSGCPSHAAMAELELRPAAKKLSEVTQTMKLLKAAMWREAGDRVPQQLRDVPGIRRLRPAGK